MEKTILIVDDEEHMLRLLRFALRSVPAQLHCVKTGGDAIAFFQRVPADLVLLDYSMPGLNGVDTLKGIRGLPEGTSTRVIMLTSRDQTSIRVDAQGLSVDAFLTKPFSPTDLERRVTEMLQGRTSAN